MSTAVYVPSTSFFYDPIKQMSPAEFKLTLEELGMDKHKAAERLGITVKQVENYLAGFRTIAGKPSPVPIPVPVILLLRLMVRNGVRPRELR